MSDTKLLSVTYSSGVICHEPDFLSTLAVFYDQIWFPYPYGLDRKGVVWCSGPPGFDNELAIVQERYEQWRAQWELLFKEEILCTLPMPKELEGGMPLELRDETMNKLGYRIDPRPTAFIDLDMLCGRIALAIHALYTDKPSPELFVTIPGLELWLLDLPANPLQHDEAKRVDFQMGTNSINTSTTEITNLLVNSLFEYHIPKLGALTADQILEVRDYLANTKQGFTDYITELTDDVEARLKSNANSVAEAARKTIERKVLPKYREFCRQLEARNIGFWSKVLEGGGKFLKIDAAPWSPKFYGEIIQIFFELLGKGADEDLKDASNQSQAFSYLVPTQQ